MPITCAAIDDEPLALELLRSYAGRISGLQWLHGFDDAIKGLQWLQEHPVDILLLDIQMPDLSGTSLARSLTVKPQIIFITAHKQFAWEGFELEAAGYLLKPVSFQKFEKAIEKAAALLKLSAGNGDAFIMVKSEYRQVKVWLKDIEFIEGLEDYIRIHLAGEKPLLTLATLKGIIEKLPAASFQRIHRSYIVPVNKVKAIGNRKVILQSGRELPVSDSYLNVVKNWKQ